MNRKRTQKLVYMSLLTAIAIVLHMIESTLPLPFPLGIKLGLANIISLVVIELYGPKEMFIINFFRVVISGLLSGMIFSYPFFMSCGGVFLSSLALLILKKINKLPMISMSIVCAICHNIGQIVVASFVISSVAFIPYLFMMLASSIPTGIITGMAAIEILKRIGKKVNP